MYMHIIKIMLLISLSYNMTKPTILCLCSQLGHLPSNQILMQIMVAIGPRFFHKDIHDFEKTECSTSLMEIKGFLQCIAANKQQWCSLVAAASCSIVAACEFFVCKLVLLLLVAACLRLLVAATLQLLVAATLQLLVAATLRLLVAATLQLLVAATLQLFVCRVCRPSCRLFLMGGVWT